MSSEPDRESAPGAALRRTLREAVAVVQMVVYRAIRSALARRHPEVGDEHLALLAGSLTNELFGSHNPGEKFVRFRRENRAALEQSLLHLREDLADLRAPLTDALRVQALCDHQEGSDSSVTLVQAKALALLLEEREVPLPSTFMQTVRELGQRQQLLTPPTAAGGDAGSGQAH